MSNSDSNILTLVLSIFMLDKILTADGILAKIGWTLLKICTGGGLLIWWLVDIIQCARGKYQVNPIKYLK